LHTLSSAFGYTSNEGRTGPCARGHLKHDLAGAGDRSSGSYRSTAAAWLYTPVWDIEKALGHMFIARRLEKYAGGDSGKDKAREWRGNYHEA